MPVSISLALARLQDPPTFGGGNDGGGNNGDIDLDEPEAIDEAKALLFPPAPLGTGTPYSWQGAFPVPYGVVNPANGNLMLSFTLTGWSGKGPDVAFTLFYNHQDTRATALGTGWRHSFLASVQEAGMMQWLGRVYRMAYLHEPNGQAGVF